MFLLPMVSGEVRCHGQDVLRDGGSSFNNNHFFTVCLDENIIVMHYCEYIWRVLLMSLRHYFLINM